jgi:polyisoprenoid-binding protein YceI
MMISNVRGRFEKFTVNAQIDEQHPERSQVEAQIDAASVNTKNEQRDGHLKSPDFLDVAKYPTITFKSKRAQALDANRGKLIGDLTIRDVTREVVLDVHYAGQAKSPWGTINAGFSATAHVNRKDWNLNWNAALETGGWLVGDEVKIEIEVEFVKQPEPAAQPEPALAA